MYKMLGKLLILDTHISLSGGTSVFYKGDEYHGHMYTEYNSKDADIAKLKHYLSAFGNDKSFWFTRPSLINALSEVGFSSIYECFNPAHLNFGKLGEVNCLEERWPEDSLSYKYYV